MQCQVDALKLTWITRLLGQSEQPWKGFVWEQVHEQLGWAAQGERAICSSLAAGYPEHQLRQGGVDAIRRAEGDRFWHSVFEAWRRLPPPEPSQDDTPHEESVLAQPLWGNRRMPNTDVPTATMRAFAARGITHALATSVVTSPSLHQRGHLTRARASWQTASSGVHYASMSSQMMDYAPLATCR